MRGRATASLFSIYICCPARAAGRQSNSISHINIYDSIRCCGLTIELEKQMERIWCNRSRLASNQATQQTNPSLPTTWPPASHILLLRCVFLSTPSSVSPAGRRHTPAGVLAARVYVRVRRPAGGAGRSSTDAAQTTDSLALRFIRG